MDAKLYLDAFEAVEHAAGGWADNPTFAYDGKDAAVLADANLCWANQDEHGIATYVHLYRRRVE